VSAVEECDLMIVHGHVVTVDAQARIIEDGAVAIAGGDIVAVGTSAELSKAYAPGRVLDAGGAAVHPGFIDGHYHAGLHLARGWITDNPNPPADEGGGGPGVFTRWINALTDEDEYASALMASLEMACNGFTGYVEAATAFEPDVVAAAAEAVGIRCSLADCMVWDIVGGEPMAADIPRAPCDRARAERVLGEQVRRRGNGAGLVKGHVALYGLGSASEELTREAKRIADAHGAVFHQHQNFMASDAAFDLQRFGKPALVHFAEAGLLDGRVVLTHMNCLEEAEAQAVSETGTVIVWHPGNLMYYGIAPGTPLRMPDLHRRGTPIGFGTDVAKVWAFGELGFIAYLVSREWGEYLPAPALLDMFTRGGAHAFGAADTLGVLAPGRKADVVIRTNDLPDAQPNADIVRQMMLVSRTKSVDTVICNGEIIVRNGRSTRLDEGHVYALARASGLRTAERAGIRRRTSMEP
jgi:cytosine/adenosine deaminase-related metal-dependent hydrolase